MFANVGGQIKTLARFHVILQTVIGMIVGGVIYTILEKTMEPSVILCIILFVAGGALGWLSGYFGAILFYAFGELVQRVQKIDNKLETLEYETYSKD